MVWKMARKVRRKIPDVSTGVEKKLDVSLLSDSAVIQEVRLDLSELRSGLASQWEQE